MRLVLFSSALNLVFQAKATAAPAPAPGLELRYTFNQRSAAAPLHTFVLKWASASGNLQTIDVMVTDSKQVLQTIAVPQDKVHLLWQEVTSPKTGLAKDKIFTLVDFNSDKFNDLRLTKSWPYAAGEKYYMVWLYNEKTNRYDYFDALSTLPGVTVDPVTHLISSMKLTGFAGGEYEESEYVLNGTGPSATLKVALKITQTAADPQHLAFYRDVQQVKDGTLTPVCHLRFPAEGLARRLSGDKEFCEAFLRKGPDTTSRGSVAAKAAPEDAPDTDDDKAAE